MGYCGNVGGIENGDYYGGGSNNGSTFALIVVLFILLIIVGATFLKREKDC
ncbi:YjcZ family sporulation protein [Lysinibacillus fusiformis]|uniref:YjcZ family sporulation protein n=1 Tax=Lysinibacillus fusiformis TaxID=28031 RepID=UPI003CF9DC00